MPNPQAPSRAGRAAANATPALMPTEVSSAEETTAGRPQSATMVSAWATPPSGATLTTIRSAASRRAAARALAVCGVAAAAPLAAARGARDQGVRAAAVEALAHLGPPGV